MGYIAKLSAAIIAALCAGCDYVPREVHEIQLSNGSTVKLACPVVDAGRSKLTYVIDGECIIYK
jgi:hypothetical protein